MLHKESHTIDLQSIQRDKYEIDPIVELEPIQTSVLLLKKLKKHISTSIWSAQHPNAGIFL